MINFTDQPLKVLNFEDPLRRRQFLCKKHPDTIDFFPKNKEVESPLTLKENQDFLPSIIKEIFQSSVKKEDSLNEGFPNKSHSQDSKDDENITTINELTKNSPFLLDSRRVFKSQQTLNIDIPEDFSAKTSFDIVSFSKNKKPRPKKSLFLLKLFKVPNAPELFRCYAEKIGVKGGIWGVLELSPQGFSFHSSTKSRPEYKPFV